MRVRPHVEDASDQFRMYRNSGDRALRNDLVQRFGWIAEVTAGRFHRRGVSEEDLHQVAMLGLIKAVERYNPDFGNSFPSYAFPTITGELRRHFRDATWPVHVTRHLQEMYLAVTSARDALTQQLGRSPGVNDLAEALSLTPDEVVEALDLGSVYRSSPLGNSDDEHPREYSRAVAVHDERLAGADIRVVLRQLLAELPEREKRIIFLRFYSELSQTEIAEQVEVSQVHVSRLLKSVLATLGDALEKTTSGDLRQH